MLSLFLPQSSTFNTSRFLIRLTYDDGLLQIHIKFPFMDRIPDRFRETCRAAFLATFPPEATGRHQRR